MLAEPLGLSEAGSYVMNDSQDPRLHLEGKREEELNGGSSLFVVRGGEYIRGVVSYGLK